MGEPLRGSTGNLHLVQCLSVCLVLSLFSDSTSVSLFLLLSTSVSVAPFLLSLSDCLLLSVLECHLLTVCPFVSVCFRSAAVIRHRDYNESLSSLLPLLSVESLGFLGMSVELFWRESKGRWLKGTHDL